tara:strand:+ start:1314 stop:2198 length:885 start_codon:yes stop_codon:yes gene_type:complete
MKFFNKNNLDFPLILKDEVTPSVLKNEILKINKLIKHRYLIIKLKNIVKKDNNSIKNFLDIKKSVLQIEKKAKEQTLEISKSINIKNHEIKKLSNEKILLDQNKIRIDILENQKMLIESYKKNNNELKKKFENISLSNNKFLINNNELKKTLSRYIKHNKNLQDSINQLEKDKSELLSNDSIIKKIKDQIKFYQDDNIRLSNEVINIQKKYELIKNNFEAMEKEKNNIFNQIQELNNSLVKNNVVGTPYLKETIANDSINSKVLNDITDTNLKDEKKEAKINNDLDEEINNIFS